MKKIINIFISISIVATTIIFLSCDKNTENNNKTPIINAATNWNDPAYYYYNKNKEKQQIQKAEANYICTGYFIKNGEAIRLDPIAFDSLDDACKHINDCINTFPDVTWVININDIPSDNMCNPV